MHTLQSLADEIELSVEDFKPLLQAFIEQTEYDLDEIKKNIAEYDSIRVSERIHSIKGAALNLGFPEISRIVEEMSSANKSGNTAAMKEPLNACFKEVDTLKRLL